MLQLKSIFARLGRYWCRQPRGKACRREDGRLWCRDRASRRRCGLTFRDKSLIVLCLLCSFCNSAFPQTATLSFWGSLSPYPTLREQSCLCYRSGIVPVPLIGTEGSGKTSITSLDDAWPQSLRPIRIATLTNPSIECYPSNLRASARPRSCRACDSSLKQRRRADVDLPTDQKRVSRWFVKQRGALTGLLRRSSHDICSLHAFCHRGPGTRCLLSVPPATGPRSSCERWPRKKARPP